jgi:hypothetical protein
MRDRDDDGRQSEDWFAEEEWEDEPTEERARPRGDGPHLPPPGSPERRRLILVAVLAALVLLVVVAAVLASGDDDGEAGPTPTPPPATETGPATGTTATDTGTGTGGTDTGTGTGGQANQVPANQTLAEDDSGPAVRALQEALNELGYDVGQPDGDFGPATAEAVRAFQESVGLPADGIAGPQTLRAINQALAQQG